MTVVVAMDACLIAIAVLHFIFDVISAVSCGRTLWRGNCCKPQWNVMFPCINSHLCLQTTLVSSVIICVVIYLFTVIYIAHFPVSYYIIMLQYNSDQYNNSFLIHLNNLDLGAHRDSIYNNWNQLWRRISTLQTELKYVQSTIILYHCSNSKIYCIDSAPTMNIL